MAFTRFHDDPCRIIKQNQQMTDQGRYMIDVPGNGDKPCFMLDPQIIPQKWGGNLWTNCVDIQSNLLGLDRRIGKDCLIEPNNKIIKQSHLIQYPVCKELTTEQSRAIMPAWTARDLEQPNWDYLFKNPQNNVERPFANNISSRILEKDHFKRTPDCLVNNDRLYLLPTTQVTKGQTICTTNNSCLSL